MRRNLLNLVLPLFVICSSANADVYVAWQAAGGFYFSATPGVGILGNATGNSTLAQLMWSVNNVADAATFGATHYASGDDQWLADLIISEDGISNDGVTFDSYALFAPVVFTDSGSKPDGGYIYARIFETATPQINDWYYVGAVVAASDLTSSDPLVTPQSYELNRDVNGDIIDGTYGAQVVAVPEPGTMALFALGVATLAAARRRRKGVTA